MMRVRLEPATPRSRVKHSTTGLPTQALLYLKFESSVMGSTTFVHFVVIVSINLRVIGN